MNKTSHRPPVIPGNGNTITNKLTHFKDHAPAFGDFPLIMAHPEGKNKALACNLTVFRNIAAGQARILTYDFKLKSIFSLKCHFHGNNKKFTYRSDKYPGDFIYQFDSMLLMAKNNLNLTYSMQLYDNRRAAPDDLLISWRNGEIIFTHFELPHKPKHNEAAIDRANVLSRIYFPLPK